MKNVAYVVAILFVTCARLQAQIRPTGTWRVEGVGNPFPWEVVLRVDGPRLMGMVSSCASPRVEISEGQIDGNTIRFNCKRADSVSTISFTGTIQGDDIAFTWESHLRDGGGAPGATNGLFGPLAPRRFTAKRVPDGELAGFFDRAGGAEFAAAINAPNEDLKVEGRLFLPRKASRVRAVIVVTEGGRGSDVYYNQRWRTLAETIEAGLLLARSSSISEPSRPVVAVMRDAIRSDSLLVLLRRLALESAHQELADVPLLFWGHSRFGSFGAGFARAHPERTIGHVAYQSGGAAPELKLLSRLPALFIQGGRDTAVLGNPRAEWLSGRAVNAPWTFAVQPDATHGDQEELKNADALMIPWVAAVVRHRVPADGTTLRALPDEAGLLGNNETGVVAPYGTFSGLKAEASWLPDAATAKGWQVVQGRAR